MECFPNAAFIVNKTPILRLNPDLDPEVFAQIYAEHGLVQVYDIFEPETADVIFEVLAKSTPWRLVYSDENGKHVLMSNADLQAAGRERMDRVARQLHSQAKNKFAYIYSSYPMLDAYLKGWDPGHPLHTIFEFLNSEEYLNFVRAITGEKDVIKVDAQATLYSPGNFLTNHDDTGDDHERRAAYTLGFTKGWRADWGGNLVFYDEEKPNQVLRTLLPGWNVLSIFRVPRPHSVTYVTPFAGAGRYSITGWLRDDPAAGSSS